jgi:hypothetical protein
MAVPTEDVIATFADGDAFGAWREICAAVNNPDGEPDPGSQSESASLRGPLASAPRRDGPAAAVLAIHDQTTRLQA